MNNRLLHRFCIVLGIIMFAMPLHAGTVRIMGIGDSITEGGGTFTSYMGPLARLLSAAGFDYGFVGPRNGSSAGISYKHAAFGGKNTEYVEQRIDSIYRTFPADIVLIHSGHNHFVEEKPVPGIVAAHRSMIDKIMQVNPDAVILIAGVIHSGKLPKYSYIAELNESLRQMVEDVNRPNVKYVSVNDGFDWRIHTIADKVHPNLTGAFVMACNWFKVLNPIILQCFVEKKS